MVVECQCAQHKNSGYIPRAKSVNVNSGLAVSSFGPPDPAIRKLHNAAWHVARGYLHFTAARPRNSAASPSSSSMRNNWLYLAIRSLRLADPVLI